MQKITRKKNILWVAHEGNVSGANFAMLEYIDVLSLDYKFHVILPHSGSMCYALKQRSISYTIVYQYGWTNNIDLNFTRRIKLFLRTAIAKKQTSRIIAREKIDAVFTNTLVSFIGAAVAYKKQKKHVWWIHEFGEEDFGFKIGFGKSDLAYKKMEKWSQLVICNSNAVTTKFRNLIMNTELIRIYQPVSWANSIHPFPQRQAKYLMFGQILQSKGHMEVLKAMSLAKKQNQLTASMHIIGPAEDEIYLHKLEEFINTENLKEHVCIQTGFFRKEEVIPKYDVLIMASKSEAFGRVIVEACKAGLKVVVKNSGGAPELVNETNGIVYSDMETLTSVFMEKILVPHGVNIMAYDEQHEVQTLKKKLAKLI